MPRSDELVEYWAGCEGRKWETMVEILRARGLGQDREVYDAIRAVLDTRETLLKAKIVNEIWRL